MTYEVGDVPARLLERAKVGMDEGKATERRLEAYGAILTLEH